MATQNQWSIFGDLSNQRTVMMSGNTGPAWSFGMVDSA